RVQSQDARLETSVVEEGSVDVGAFTELEADLRPRTSRGRFGGSHRVVLTNKGNAPTSVQLSGSDDEQALRLRLSPRSLVVRPGTSAVVGRKARCARTALTGTPKQWPFRAVAEVEGAVGAFGAPVPAVQVQGAMEQRPVLGRFAMRTIAVGVVAL